MRVQKELVLLHREHVAHPTGTVKWLNALGWLSSHFHVSNNNIIGTLMATAFVISPSSFILGQMSGCFLQLTSPQTSKSSATYITIELHHNNYVHTRFV